MLHGDAHSDAWLLKDVGNQTPLLGCSNCLDREICGGLHLPNGSAVLTCLDFCQCADPQRCDIVCPKVPDRYARRIHEIHGLQFDDIPRHPAPDFPDLSGYIPIVEGRVSQRRPVEIDYAAIPLSRAVKGRGPLQRAKTREELIRDHGISPRKGWLVTGIEDDRFVERFWRLPKYREIFHDLRNAGVVYATTPNFSLYADTPRHDNLHAMKRIAWMWHLMNQAGLPTALHINGRTDHDFSRWREFILARPEITSIAFEFLTGARLLDDAERYFARITSLAQGVKRPLTLVMRGSQDIAKRLEEVFEKVIWLDSTPYFKAMHRHELIGEVNGAPRYARRKGDPAAPIGGLFKSHAVAAQRRYRDHQTTVQVCPQMSFDLLY